MKINPVLENYSSSNQIGQTPNPLENVETDSMLTEIPGGLLANTGNFAKNGKVSTLLTNYTNTSVNNKKRLNNNNNNNNHEIDDCNSSMRLGWFEIQFVFEFNSQKFFHNLQTKSNAKHST